MGGTQTTFKGTGISGFIFGKYGKGTTKTTKARSTIMEQNSMGKRTEFAMDNLKGGEGTNGTGFP